MPDETVAYWRTGNTRPAVVIDLQLGEDPETGVTRTLAPTDTVTQHMRRVGTGTNPVITRQLTVLDAALNRVRYKPAAGDIDIDGDYRVEFDITDNSGDIETIPDTDQVGYVYHVGARV